MAVQLEFLKSIPYFAGMNPGELDLIKQQIFEKTAERGEVVLLEGESAEALFFVASGVVKAFKTSAEGKEQILYLIRPGESFNDVSIFVDGPNLASAQALGPVTVYGLRKSELQVILRDYPQVTLNIIKVLADRAHQLILLVEDLSFRRVINRVAKILLKHAGDGTDPMPRLTQQVMADMAGTAREVVARSLKALEQEGVIRLEHNRIAITNKGDLKQMVESAI